MRYADSLLTEGEVVVLRSRQHWLSILARTRLGLLLWGLAILLLIGIVWFNVAPASGATCTSWLGAAAVRCRPGDHRVSRLAVAVAGLPDHESAGGSCVRDPQQALERQLA